MARMRGHYFMDVIIIEDLEVHYHVGVPDEERAQPQKLRLTLEVEHDFRGAVAADDVGATIDYDALTRRLLAFGDDCQWRLIETLASDIANMVLDDFQARRVTVEVKKFVIPQARHVAVRLVRAGSHAAG